MSEKLILLAGRFPAASGTNFDRDLITGIGPDKFIACPESHLLGKCRGFGGGPDEDDSDSVSGGIVVNGLSNRIGLHKQ